jgi:methylthioribose-1-phosphate isomerase
VSISAIQWNSGRLRLLDQRLLPLDEVWLDINTCSQAATAITDMVVRGAPAIAITAGYGLALALREGRDRASARAELMASRPTAVNLRWALERLDAIPDEGVEAEAEAIHAEDLAINRALGDHGARVLPEGGVLHHCNTGALATAGWGTALGVVRSMHAMGRSVHCYATETRPYLQGARLTAWELVKEGIPGTLITDSMAAAAMADGRIQACVVGCDRVAANGDVANKIGTYGLAVLARYHGIPFYVAMPTSTLDTRCATGADIPIEERPADELRSLRGQQIAPSDIGAWNPAFDVTPATLVTGWITEHGMWSPPDRNGPTG